VTHGDVTFYEAQALASLLTDHDRVREVFDVVPEELLTDEIRDLQRSGNVDDHTGFEYAPGLVLPASRFTTSNATWPCRQPECTSTRCSRWSLSTRICGRSWVATCPSTAHRGTHLGPDGD
jgi:hypothetical protein